MYAAVVHGQGKTPQHEEFAEPVPAESEALVEVRAAALNPSTKAVMSGAHYASGDAFPTICGLDGVGVMPDGGRVYFGGPRQPFGSFAQRTVVAAPRCWPVPDGVDDVTAAALPNAALSSWLPLAWTAKLKAGETVLVMGATGNAGSLAVQVAKLLGAGRVVAAGRNEEALEALRAHGADATVRLGGDPERTEAAFAEAAGESGYDVILDYLWGEPVEMLLRSMTRSDFHLGRSGPRLVQIGESAGSEVRISAGLLRSTGLAVMGSSFPPPDVFMEIFNELMNRAAAGDIHLETEAVPLANVAEAWEADGNDRRRKVIVP